MYGETDKHIYRLRENSPINKPLRHIVWTCVGSFFLYSIIIQIDEEPDRTKNERINERTNEGGNGHFRKK